VDWPSEALSSVPRRVRPVRIISAIVNKIAATTRMASQHSSTHFGKLPPITTWRLDSQCKLIGTRLEEDQMRITFLRSVVPHVRRAQQEMSVFVEVGWDPIKQCQKDQFVFDRGSGVCSNYGSMWIGYGRMDKIFLANLHADHMSDLAHIYCFGPSADRKSPLYAWGPGSSGVKSLTNRRSYVSHPRSNQTGDL